MLKTAHFNIAKENSLLNEKKINPAVSKKDASHPYF